MTGTNHGTSERVVVGVDGSAASARALAWAARYGELTGAHVCAVRAWHYPSQVGPAPIGVAPASVSEEVERGQHEQLDEAIAKALGDQPAVDLEHKVSYGHASQVLIDESRGADLLVVGSHGHGGFIGMMLGSVGHHCVTHAACPVTVVRGP